jgi:hypothetical protein
MGTLLISTMYVVPYSYLLNSRAPWSTVLLEKLTDAQSVVAFMEFEDLLPRSREAAIYIYILTHIKSVHTVTPCVFKVSYIIMF